MALGGDKVHSIGLIFLILNFKARDVKFCKNANKIILRHSPKKGKKKFTPPLAQGGVKVHSIGLIFLILNFEARDLKFGIQAYETFLRHFL